MALFGKLNNVMSAKRIANQPLDESKREALEESIIFGNATQTMVEEVRGAKIVTADDLLTESIIADSGKYSRMREVLLDIKENS